MQIPLKMTAFKLPPVWRTVSFYLSLSVYSAFHKSQPPGRKAYTLLRFWNTTWFTCVCQWSHRDLTSCTPYEHIAFSAESVHLSRLLLDVGDLFWTLTFSNKPPYLPTLCSNARSPVENGKMQISRPHVPNWFYQASVTALTLSHMSLDPFPLLLFSSLRV